MGDPPTAAGHNRRDHRPISAKESRILRYAGLPDRPLAVNYANYLATGGHHPGLVLVARSRPFREVVDALVLIARRWRRPDEYLDQVNFIP